MEDGKYPIIFLISIKSNKLRMNTSIAKPEKSDAIHNASRTEQLLELMKKGDNAFNARDFAGMKAVHHADMIAHITGNAQPVYGQEAHSRLIKEMFYMFPDVHVYNNPYPIQFGSGDWITVICRITGTFSGEMKLPDGKVIAPTKKAFDVEFCQTSRWEGDQLIIISAFWDAALQARQIGLA
jgi:SnoaL-like polyketide cyclase